jgi:hypothetical protein
LAHRLNKPCVPVFHAGLSRRQVEPGSDRALTSLMEFLGPTLEDLDDAHLDHDLAAIGERVSATVTRSTDM